MKNEEYYKTRGLLSRGNTNTKMAKNAMRTYGLSLAPHKLNSHGVNLCRFSTNECRSMCLNSSGRAGMSSIQLARKRKTDFFIENEKEFMEILFSELSKLNVKGGFAVRLNVVSDVNWEDVFFKYKKSMADFKNIQFYDYSKDHFKIAANKIPNYHLTYSFSGSNWVICEDFLKRKIANVTVVFKNIIPTEYRGYKVINGDKTDERFLDEKGVVVGLKYKVPRGVNYETNKFVVE